MGTSSSTWPASSGPSPNRARCPPSWKTTSSRTSAAPSTNGARDLREWWQRHWSQTGGEGDPLLDALDEARRSMLRAEQHLRLLVAYGYEFVRPRGYTLAQLAAHADMSISGVRTAYDLENEGCIIEERTGVGPAARASEPADEQ